MHNKDFLQKLQAFIASLFTHILFILVSYYSTFLYGNRMGNLNNNKSRNVTLFVNKKTQIKKITTATTTTINKNKFNKISTIIKNEEPLIKKITVDNDNEKPNNDLKTDISNNTNNNLASLDNQNEANSNIDNRAIYNISSSSSSTGEANSEPFLELHGWVWDYKPEPNDDTDETGMIIFEIKIDNNGEVVGVKTIEKTISALLEKVYRESLERLSFSKTSAEAKYAPSYTGKVTFIIKEK